MNGISVQMYSLKESAKNDFAGTVRKVAQIGYNGIELAGYGNMEAKEMKRLLDDTGLKVSGAHIGLDELRDNLEYHIGYNKVIGNKYLICPWTEIKGKSDADALKADLESIAARLDGTGMVLGFHNHDSEFMLIDGQYAFDHFMSGKDDMIYELDCYWSEFAGVDTVKYLEKIGDRCPLVHLKDMRIEPDGSKKSTVFGEGILDNISIVDAAMRFCNPEWLVIEWEAFDIYDIDAVKKSYINLLDIIKKQKIN